MMPDRDRPAGDAARAYEASHPEPPAGRPEAGGRGEQLLSLAREGGWSLEAPAELLEWLASLEPADLPEGPVWEAAARLLEHIADFGLAASEPTQPEDA